MSKKYNGFINSCFGWYKNSWYDTDMSEECQKTDGGAVVGADVTGKEKERRLGGCQE
jgi:hypothetical protein